MQNVSIEKLKQFEKMIINCLLEKYGKNIPQPKITLLSTKSFMTEDLLKNNSNFESLQGDIIRTVLSGIIDVRCTKEIKIDGKEENINYGQYLQEGLIEYYTHELANTYNIKVNEIPELKDNLEMITLLKEKLEDNLDSVVFIKTATEILEKEELKDLLLKNDSEEIKAHISKKQGISTSGKKGIIDEQKKDVSLSEKERIQLVYIDGKQYIKYVDKEDQVHLVESRDPYKISEIYKSALERIKDPKQFDAKYLFDELTSVLGEKPSETIEEINPDYLTSEEVNMIDFIHSNERYKNNLKNDTVRHFKGMNLHAIEETNDIVATTDHDGLIESTHIKDNNIKQDLSTTKVEKPEKEVNKEKELTLDEYEELLAKFANNSDLSLDELRALRHSNVSQGLEEELEEEIEKKTSGPTLSLTGSKYPLAGFIDKYTLTFFIIMTSCIGILVGALLFKTMFFN